MSTKVADDIPEEIMVQILHKLPVKSLVRFTCVYKAWLTLIKSPSFISDHLKHSISCSDKNPLLFLHYSSKQDQSNYSLYFDNEEYDHYMELHFPFKTQNPKSHFSVVGAVNGLICLLGDDGQFSKKTIIWNPLVKKSITLPKPSIKCLNRDCYGFEFDSRSNDYKVLRLAQRFSGFEVKDEEQEPDVDILEAEICSLDTNSWKRICAPRYEVRRFLRHFLANGVMHVLAFRRLRNNEYYNLILRFDVADEVFKKIALPQSLAALWPYYLRPLVYKESIAVLVEGWNETGVHVWVMKEYGVVESWTKIFSFDEEEESWAYVFGFRRNGELFLEKPDGEIVSCKPESRENKSLGVSHGVSGLDPFVHYFVESLELLDNANAQSDQSVENHAIGDAAGVAND